jgi:hypothetical protein
MADRHVRRSGNDYAHQLVSLLPRGPAWSRDPGSTLMRAVIGLAQYWGFVDSRAGDLLEIESDPRTTWELLPGARLGPAGSVRRRTNLAG